MTHPNIPEASGTKITEPEKAAMILAQASPAMVTVAIGIAASGPVCGEVIGDVKQGPYWCRDWDHVKEVFGDYFIFADGTRATIPELAAGYNVSAKGLYVIRTAHFTDASDPSTLAALRSSGDLAANVAVATYGTVASGNTAPFLLEPADDLDISINGGGDATATFDAAAALIESGAAETWDFSGGKILTLEIDEGWEQTITFVDGDFGTPTAATAEEVCVVINKQIEGGHAEATTTATKVTVVSDKKGTGSHVRITGGTANTLLTFSTTKVDGTGDVADIRAVTIAEVKAVVENDVAGSFVIDDGDNTFSIRTTLIGSAGSIQVKGTGTAQAAGKLNLDTTLHEGTDSSSQTTAVVDAKWRGKDGDTIKTKVEDATSEEADRFDLVEYKNGDFVRRWRDLIATTTDDRFAENVINHPTTGSWLITYTDQALDERPDNQEVTLSAGDDGLTGLVDADFIGYEGTAFTGMHGCDLLESVDQIIKGWETAVFDKALATYAKDTLKAVVWGEIPVDNSETQAVSYITAGAMFNYNEHIEWHYPWVNIANPNRSVFGTAVEEVPVRSSGYFAGLQAKKVLDRRGGIYSEPAGLVNGVLPMPVTSLVNPNMKNKGTRDYLFRNGINPINVKRGVLYLDGELVAKQDGNFHTLAQRFGIDYIEKVLYEYMEVKRHGDNTENDRRDIAKDMIDFLEDQTDLGAFASPEYDKAFKVDYKSGNTPATERTMKGYWKIGVARKEPLVWAYLEVGYDETEAIVREL